MTRSRVVEIEEETGPHPSASYYYVSSYYYMCPNTTYVSSYYYICVLVQLYTCPHATISVSSYYLHVTGASIRLYYALLIYTLLYIDIYILY